MAADLPRPDVGAFVRILPTAPQSYRALHGCEGRVIPPRPLDSPAFVRVRVVGSPREAILRPSEVELLPLRVPIGAGGTGAPA